jgi:hypothetical protein
MKKYVLLAATLVACVVMARQVSVLHAGEVQPGKADPPALGLQWAREFVHGAAPAGRGNSPNLVWHNGAIMNNATTAAIFWGTRWSNASFQGDKISGLDSWYSGVGGSPYITTNTEYTGTNGQVGTAVGYGGSFVDTTAAPSGGPSTSTIQAEVCKVIPASTIQANGSNGYYAVYVDTPRGNAGYCAWHSYGSCGGTPVQFAFFFNLDGDSGCDPQDNSGQHSQGLAALANVSGHELSEAFTDPRNGGWYDKQGAENADKCAWSFGTPLLTFTNRTQWKIQGNWSNNAYNNKTGYPNRSGQYGCLDGGNYQ